MAIAINVQGFVDAMVQRMQDNADPLRKDAVKAVSVEFSNIVEAAIDKHTAKINELMSVADGERINAKAIEYHSKKLDYYMA